MTPEIVFMPGASPTLLEQLAPYSVIAGGLLALGGIWIGRQLERRHAKEAWLSDQRLRVYCELLDADVDLERAIHSVFFATWEERDITALRTCRREYNRAVFAVNLLGPAVVDKALGPYDVALDELLETLVERPKWDAAHASAETREDIAAVPEYQAYERALHELRQAFEAAIR